MVKSLPFLIVNTHLGWGSYLKPVTMQLKGPHGKRFKVTGLNPWVIIIIIYGAGVRVRTSTKDRRCA